MGMDELLPHSLTLERREKLTMTGVTEVVRFDEETVELRTELGTLLVQGRDLKLRTLSPKGGAVAVECTVTAIGYEEPREHRGIRGLFR
jgi:sporulation protein YabP